MAYKTILVLCDASDAASNRLEFAHRLACAHGAHLTGLYLPPEFMSPTTLLASLDIVKQHQRHEENVKPDMEKTKALFESIVKESASTSEWHSSLWSPLKDAVKMAECADLVVVGQDRTDRNRNVLPHALPEALVIWSGRPVLVVPLLTAAPAALQRGVICWDGSREAALAASQALPLLMAAENVDVLMVLPDRNLPGSPHNARSDPITWLGRHGVAAMRHCRKSLSDDFGGEILRYASGVGADFIVMGGYGRSRMRQAVLGGTSRTVLEGMSVPVLMAH